MSRLNVREVDAVVETVIRKIEEASKDLPQFIEYDKNCEKQKQLDKECRDRINKFIKDLLVECEGSYPEFEFDINNYQNTINISRPTQPLSVSRRDIERELIIANISGNIEETLEKIIKKHTTNE